VTPVFDAVLDREALKEYGVSRETLAEVLARVVAAAPEAVPRVNIADGAMLVPNAKLPQGSVSRASGLLLRLGILEEEAAAPERAERPGRPIVPLRLGRAWALAGVKIRHREGYPVQALGVLTGLDGSMLTDPVAETLTDSRDHVGLVKSIAYVVQQLHQTTPRRLLGLGVELGGHVHRGRVLFSPNNTWDDFPLGELLSEKLNRLPTIVENDVNARAIREVWKRDRQAKSLRFPQMHLAVVAVYNDGVGGALVINRKVYRGSRGCAGEVGHMTVDYSRPYDDPKQQRRSKKRPGFNDPCRCEHFFYADALADGGAFGHVDALATPSRIEGELGIPFARAARQRATLPNGQLTRAGAAFRTAGEALGRALAAVFNLTDPASFLLLLPNTLAHAAEGTAAAEYRKSVDKTLGRLAFSCAADDARNGGRTVLVEGMDPDDAVSGARAAAACVLDSFIAYARGEDTESLAEGTEPARLPHLTSLGRPISPSPLRRHQLKM